MNPLVSLLALLLAVIPSALSGTELVDPMDRARHLIDGYVEQSMERYGTPGITLALTDRERVLLVATYGFADIKTERPVTSETLFQIGSITKSFTAVALLQLEEEKAVDLRAPLNDYLPWFEVQSDYPTLTAHDLLTHSAGIPANRDDIWPSAFMTWALRERSTAWSPGERFKYSNVGYQVLHQLIEKQSRTPYAELVAERLLEPLGMTRSVSRIGAEMRLRQAVGYGRLYDDRPSHLSHPLVEAQFMAYDVADGSIASTASDMTAWVRMRLNRGAGPEGRLLSTASFDRLTTLWMSYDDEQAEGENGYGYGIGIDTVDGRRRLRHSGGMIGFSAQIIADLDSGLGVVALINGPGDPTANAEFALEAARSALAGTDLPKIPSPTDPTQVENADDYTGEFVTTDGRKIGFVARGARLLLQSQGNQIQGNETPLERRGEDHFVTAQDGFDLFTFAFGRDDDGNVQEVAYGPDWYVNDRYKGPKEFHSPAEWIAYVGQYRSYSPWFSNFRVILRKGELLAVTAEGVESAEGEAKLTPISPGAFRIGDAPSPETLEFDSLAEGRALRASWSGHVFHRVGPLLDR